MKTENILKGHELFRSLNTKDADLLSNASASKTLQTGETVYTYGGRASHIFVLLNGEVHLKLPAEHQTFGIVVSKVGVGELFGISPLLNSMTYTTTAVSACESEILTIEAQVLREVLLRNATVALDVLNRVAQVYFTRYLEVMKSLQAVVNQIPFER